MSAEEPPMGFTDPRSNCPIVQALDIVGDRWTLVILRDLFSGKKRYSEFLQMPERITTSILAERLARMERTGLISKAAYQNRPTRYEYTLTDKGMDLIPLMQAMARWANKYFPDSMTPPKKFIDVQRDGL